MSLKIGDKIKIIRNYEDQEGLGMEGFISDIDEEDSLFYYRVLGEKCRDRDWRDCFGFWFPENYEKYLVLRDIKLDEVKKWFSE